MSRVLPELVVGVIALVVGMFAGYRCWRPPVRRTEDDGTDIALTGIRAAIPLFLGLAAGCVFLAVASGIIVVGDRFYRPLHAVATMAAVLAGGAVILAGYAVAGQRTSQTPDGTPGRPVRGRWMISLCLEIVASLIVVGAGVRFSILSVGTGAELPLGEWAVPLTVLWLVGATNVVKLLDGLEGAVSVLLLVGAVAVAYTTIGVPEHFLNAFSIAMIGATLASLRFNAYPARLSLRGPGSAFAGFLFAVLTVLARQKTVAALLLVFPLLLIVIIVGGAMLSFLERTVLIGDNDKE